MDSHTQRHVLIVDNIPVLAAVVMPSILIMVAGLGLVSLDVALDASVVLSLTALYALGAYQARRSGATLGMQIGIGALGGIVGIFVIALEVLLEHPGRSLPPWACARASALLGWRAS